MARSMGPRYTFDEFLTEGPGYWVPNVLPRSLTVDERQLIQALLAVPFPGREQLQRQVASLQVLFHAPGGDPSIKMSPTRDPALAANCRPRGRVPIEARGLDGAGQPIVVYLHVIEGFIGELEVEVADADTRPSSLPALAGLYVY